MKKNVFVFSALCLATMTLVFSGCKKENNDPQEPAKVQTYRMSINASKGTDQQANGPRRVISLGGGGTTLTATWTTGDKVYVYNGSTELGYLEASDNNANTQLNGTLTGEVSVGDELTLKYLSANYTGQNGTLTYISANCDYATASVTVETVAGGEITTTADANFENQQAIVKFTLKDAEDHTTLLSPTALIFNDGTADIATLTTIPDATYTTNGAGVLYVAVPGFSGKDITLTATVGSDTYTFNKTSTTLTNGQYYILTVEMTKQAPAYKEYGPFSVSSTQRVNFAQGNLQFTKSTGKFEFMTNQYDMVETINQNVGTDYASQDVISLFGWATSNINEPANTYYYPWETDKTSASYGSGITTENINWAKDYANYDWGKNMGTGWRTLTKDEWVYLFNTRTGDKAATVNSVANCRYTKAAINTDGTAVNGIILFPDGGTFAASEFTAVGSPNTTNAKYTTQCTTLQWTDLQTKGCVFLPAAGNRNGASVSLVGSCGYYWSSTSYSSTDAYFMYFTGGLVLPESHYARYYGFSVRLVKNVE